MNFGDIATNLKYCAPIHIHPWKSTQLCVKHQLYYPGALKFRNKKFLQGKGSGKLPLPCLTFIPSRLGYILKVLIDVLPALIPKR